MSVEDILRRYKCCREPGGGGLGNHQQTRDHQKNHRRDVFFILTSRDVYSISYVNKIWYHLLDSNTPTSLSCDCNTYLISWSATAYLEVMGECCVYINPTVFLEHMCILVKGGLDTRFLATNGVAFVDTRARAIRSIFFCLKNFQPSLNHWRSTVGR